MRNLVTRYAAYADLKLANLRPNCVKIFENLTGTRVLFAVHTTEADRFTLSCRQVPSPTPTNASAGDILLSDVSDIVVETVFNSTPVSLCVLEGGVSLVVCCQGGEILQIDPTTGAYDVVGEVVDEDSAKSGIMAATASPDGHLLALVSPVKTLVLDTAWDLVAELEHSCTLAQAGSVAWRGDGAYFVSSVEDAAGTITGVVVDRECADVKRLDVSAWPGEGDENLDITVTWQPRVGGMICHAGPGNALTFFERNGLRHLRSDVILQPVTSNTPNDGGRKNSPKLLAWSHDSTMLALSSVQSVAGASRVNVYTRNNFKWYNKKSIEVYGEVVDICWDEDQVDCVSIVTADGICIVLQLFSIPSSSFNLSVGSHCGVIDGPHAIVTNLSHAAVPPPMNHGVFEFVGPVNELCDLASKNSIGALLSNGFVDCLSLQQGLCDVQFETTAIDGKQLDVERTSWRIGDPISKSHPFMSLRFPVFLDGNIFVAVCPSSEWMTGRAEPSDAICVYHLKPGGTDAEVKSKYIVEGRVAALAKSQVSRLSLLYVNSKGSVVKLALAEESWALTEIASVTNSVSPETVSITDCKVGGSRALILTHDDIGGLRALELGSEKSAILSTECTSYCTYEGFLTFTTRSHLLYCLVLDTKSSKSYQGEKDQTPCLIDILDQNKDEAVFSGNAGIQLGEGEGATRPIDRGSVIVSALPDDVSIVLQAPRGNLETIAPRPVVYEAVDTYAKLGEYGKAFRLCRRQRVDMNHIVDANYELFLRNVRAFVEQVGKVSHLSIFMTFLKGNSDKVNTVCDAIVKALTELEQPERYTTAVLTGLIRREPPDHAKALDHVRQSFDRNLEEGAAALDYLFVLIKNEEEVYKHALGTYDLKLALLVAKSSQMDPAEFSEELVALSCLDENMRKYTIDVKIERYDSALRHLHACGEEKYGSCISLCHEHALYETALGLFEENDDFRSELLRGFAMHLRSTSRYEESAAVFIQTGDWREASKSYQEGRLWQLAVSAASNCRDMSVEEKQQVYKSVAEDLIDSGEVKEAARIKLTLLGDVDGAVASLASAGEWETAFETAAIHSVNRYAEAENTDEATVKSVWNEIEERVLEGTEGLLATITENKSKLGDRRKRLGTVRETKRLILERLGAKGGNEEVGETDSDVFSASTASSLVSNLSDVTFTSKTSATSLYTTLSQTGPLSAAKLEKQAEKRRRKASRKRIREGHPKEEEYLVEYLRKLVPGEYLRKRVRDLVRALLYIRRMDQVRKVIREMDAYVQEAALLPVDVLNTEELQRGVESREWAVDIGYVEQL